MLHASVLPVATMGGRGRRLMGHADLQTTMIYVHDVPKVTEADELSRVVAAAMAPAEQRGQVPASVEG